MSAPEIPVPATQTDEKARYEAMRKELIDSLNQKRQADKQLAQIEVQIYNAETSYLTDTTSHGGGNIVHGFENYLKNQASGRRRNDISENDRVFSQSSLTYTKSLDLLGEGEESSATADDYRPGVTTVIVPAASRGDTAASKKNRDREYQRKKRASLSRQSVDTNSEDEVFSTVSGRRSIKRARIDDD